MNKHKQYVVLSVVNRLLIHPFHKLFIAKLLLLSSANYTHSIHEAFDMQHNILENIYGSLPFQSHNSLSSPQKYSYYQLKV
jgi:hypothetical protein